MKASRCRSAYLGCGRSRMVEKGSDCLRGVRIPLCARGGARRILRDRPRSGHIEFLLNRNDGKSACSSLMDCRAFFLKDVPSAFSRLASRRHRASSIRSRFIPWPGKECLRNAVVPEPGKAIARKTPNSSKARGYGTSANSSIGSRDLPRSSRALKPIGV